MIWIASIVSGTANDAFFMALPIVDNFWQVNMESQLIFNDVNVIIGILLEVFCLIFIYTLGTSMHYVDTKNATLHSLCLCCLHVHFGSCSLEVRKQQVCVMFIHQLSFLFDHTQKTILLINYYHRLFQLKQRCECMGIRSCSNSSSCWIDGRNDILSV